MLVGSEVSARREVTNFFLQAQNAHKVAAKMDFAELELRVLATQQRPPRYIRDMILRMEGERGTMLLRVRRNPAAMILFSFVLPKDDR